MRRNELVAIIVAAVLVIALVLGVLVNLWSLSSVLSLFPYFIIFAIVSILGWGFSSRIRKMVRAQEPAPSETRAVSPNAPPVSTGSVAEKSTGEASGREGTRLGRWRIQSVTLPMGPVTIARNAPAKVKVIFSETVKVPKAVLRELPFLLEVDDSIEGTATDRYGRNFDWYFLDDKGYADYYADRRPEALASGTDTPSAHIRVKIPHSGTWHLVLDNMGKRSSRAIEVRLTKTRPG